MTPERFEVLAEAYGINVDSWPSGERGAARRFLDEHPSARIILAQADELDSVLKSWRAPGPGAALAARIATIADRRQVLAWRLRLWLSGLGAATALASGLAVGVMAVDFSAPVADRMSTNLYGLHILCAPLDIEGGAETEGP